MESEKKRLFVGIPVEETLKEAFNAFYMDQPYDPKMRWTPLENLHVTIVFKGKTLNFMIPEMKEKMAEYLKSKPSFDLTFSNYITMPFRDPRMVWAKYEPHPIHTLLANGLANILRTEADKKPIPHITLARFKMEADYKLLKLDLPLESKKITVNKIHLYESILHPAGPEYKILDTYFMA